MLRFLLGVAVGLAAASAIQSKQRGSGGFRAAGDRVDELSTAQDDPSFGIGQLNAGDGTPSNADSSPAHPSTRDRMGAGGPANPAPTRTAGGATSDTFNGA